MAITVLATDFFSKWLSEQTTQIQDQVAHVIVLLQQEGPALGYPYSSKIEGVDFPLRELRPASGKSPARAFYAFDPNRSAVVLCGGCKQDSGDMYERARRDAKREWAAHLELVAKQWKAEKEKTKGKKEKRKK